MRERFSSVWFRYSARTAAALVRLWPEESRRWGRAFAAELGEITKPAACFGWLLGGVMLLAREWWKSVFRGFGRPVGVPAGGPVQELARQSRRFPRTPRVVTLVLLLAAGAILLHPDVRAGMRASLRSLSGDGSVGGNFNWNPDPARWSSVARLRREAHKNHDPELLALLSLLSENDSERVRLADEAIRRDPSLTWLDYENAGPHLPTDRLERLRKWDPDNAVVRELAAEEAAYRLGEFGSVLWEPSDAKREGAPDRAPDPAWIAAMDAVFRAPKYDNYSRNLFRLLQDVSNKYQIHDPDLALFTIVQMRLPSLVNMYSYGRWLLAESARKEHAGDVAGATRDAWEVLLFAERAQTGALIEKLVSLNWGMKACDRLQPLLASQGKAEEAALMAAQRTAWEAEVQRTRTTSSLDDFDAWNGLTMRLAVIAILLTGMACCVSLLWLWLAPGSALRGKLAAALSLLLDGAPPVLLGACTIFFLAYRPAAQMYHAYFSAGAGGRLASDLLPLVDAGITAHAIPFGVLPTPIALWTTATAALAALAAILIFRIIHRARWHPRPGA